MTTIEVERRRAQLLTGAALVVVYLVWGSTYFVMRVAMKMLDPFLMCGLRFVTAGALLLVFLRLRGTPLPNARQWLASAIVGALLLVFGNGFVAIAERTVDSGVAATVVATVPLWAAGIAMVWGERATRLELLGLALGFCGVLILHRGGSLGARGRELDTLAIVIAPIAWATGSVWSRRLPLPKGLMASAAQMLTGGVMLLFCSVLHGESLPARLEVSGVASFLYLVVFGSLIAFSAYGFLLRTASPAVATSYAYANPVVALAIGALFNGEGFTSHKALACALTVAGVAVVLAGRARSRPVATAASAVK